MKKHSKFIDQALTSGSIVVAFLSARYNVSYHRGVFEIYSWYKEAHSSLAASNWDFAAAMKSVIPAPEAGQEIVFSEPSLRSLFAKSGTNSTFYTSLEFQTIELTATPLALNRHGRTVAAVLRGGILESGTIVLLPQMPNFNEVIVDFLTEFLAPLSPKLFPFDEKLHWTHLPEYEVHKIIALENELREVTRKFEQESARLTEAISQSRAENQPWYTLLSGTGRELVLAVIEALTAIGFTDVRDCDLEPEDPRNLREDIQIFDRSPVIVVDVKGVAGRPEDVECSQASKHARLRRREWNRTDVNDLTIINSQRTLPPAHRNPEAFSENQLVVAEENSNTLMTAIDLAILWRNSVRLNWPSEAVKELFYQPGRLRPVPTHYHYVGRVIRVWPQKGTFGINPQIEIRSGMRMAVRRGLDYFEFEAESLMIQYNGVMSAGAGTDCGIKIANITLIKEGDEIYYVENLSQLPPEVNPAQ